MLVTYRTGTDFRYVHMLKAGVTKWPLKLYVRFFNVFTFFSRIQIIWLFNVFWVVHVFSNCVSSWSTTLLVWYGMVNVDLYSAIITKVSNALMLPTLLSDGQVSISLVIHGLWWTVLGQVKAHVVLTCTTGVSSNHLHVIGNESVPKIIIRDALNLFFWKCNQHFGNFKP